MTTTHAGLAAPPKTRPGFYGLLDQLRGLAALLVVWAHLVGYFLEVTARSWIPYELVDRFIQVPLGIVENFGYFGVALFFFISGFVITHAASRESSNEFIVKRLLRIYPPLILALILTIAVTVLAGYPITGVNGAPLNWLDVLSNFTLTNYAYAPRAVLLTVAWTLAVEMTFYLFMWVLRGLVGKRAIFVSPIILASILLLILVSGRITEVYAIAVTAANVALLVIGQVCYLVATKRIHIGVAALYGVLAWGIYVYGVEKISPQNLVDGNVYPSNAFFAFLIFLVAVLAEGKLRPSKALGVVAKRSYSLYLIHAPLGLTILGLLNNNADLPYTVMLLIALVAVAVAVEVSYRLVERPTIRFAKYLFKKPPIRAQVDAA